MKLTPYLAITLIVAGCGTGSASVDGSSTLPTGAEIGKTASDRTVEAEKNGSGVIIASSNDNAAGSAERGAEAPSSGEPDAAAPKRGAIGAWIEVDAAGKMTDAEGEEIESLPTPSKAQRIVVRHRSGVSAETVEATVAALKEAGWGDVQAVAIAEDAEAAPGENKAEPAKPENEPKSDSDTSESVESETDKE